jgi:hypothetical protein
LGRMVKIERTPSGPRKAWSRCRERSPGGIDPTRREVQPERVRVDPAIREPGQLGDQGREDRRLSRDERLGRRGSARRSVALGRLAVASRRRSVAPAGGRGARMLGLPIGASGFSTGIERRLGRATIGGGLLGLGGANDLEYAAPVSARRLRDADQSHPGERSGVVADHALALGDLGADGREGVAACPVGAGVFQDVVEKRLCAVCDFPSDRRRIASLRRSPAIDGGSQEPRARGRLPGRARF